MATQQIIIKGRELGLCVLGYAVEIGLAEKEKEYKVRFSLVNGEIQAVLEEEK